MLIVGYLLSPFSLWNDVVVNILPSVFLAQITTEFLPFSVLALAVTYYVLSNVLGLVMMGLASRALVANLDLVPSRRQVLNGGR